MDTLILTRARYRRRYGNDMPESSLPSRFLEEIPSHLIEDLSWHQLAQLAHGAPMAARPLALRPQPIRRLNRPPLQLRGRRPERRHCNTSTVALLRRTTGKARQLARQHCAILHATRRVGSEVSPEARHSCAHRQTGLKSGQRVRHPKYGEGIVFRREGDGEDAKITVQFSKFGVKKLVEKFAQLESWKRLQRRVAQAELIRSSACPPTSQVRKKRGRRREHMANTKAISRHNRTQED